jgi:hypothetical protein
LYQYNKTFDYKILYNIGTTVDGTPFNKNRYPDAHTCFNLIDIYGFPDNIVSFEGKRDFIYDKIHTAVFNTLGMDNE